MSHTKNCDGEWDLFEHFTKVKTEQEWDAGSQSKQLDLGTAFQVKATAQEKALDHWMKLVTIHNIPITKLQYNAFCMLLSCKKISHVVFIQKDISCCVHRHYDGAVHDFGGEDCS